MSLQELEDWLRERGEPKFRAGQIFRWLHKKNVASFPEMTDQSAALRGVLVENFYINSIKIKKKLVSKVDGFENLYTIVHYRFAGRLISYNANMGLQLVSILKGQSITV